MTATAPYRYRRPAAQASSVASPASTGGAPGFKSSARRPRKGRATRQLFEKHEEQLTQAERVFRKFGGARDLMRALKAVGCTKNASSIYRWNYPREKGGCGGLIPTAAWPEVLAAARLEGVHLAPEDLDPRETYRFRKKVVATIGADGVARPYIPAAELRERARVAARIAAEAAAKAERQREKAIANKEESIGGVDDIFG